MEETIMENSVESAPAPEPMEAEAHAEITDTAGTAGEAAEERPAGTYQPLRVKYNGAERELTPEEAVVYAQKGMNYDKIHQRLKEYEGNSAAGRAYALVEKLAARRGVSPGEYLDEMESQREQAEIDAIAGEKGLSAPQAKEIREARRENERLFEENQFNREFQELVAEHPEIRPGGIPEDAIYFRSRYGLPLKEAYRLTAGYEKLKQEKDQLQRQLQIREETQKNSGLSTGSARGAAKTPPPTDRIGRMSLAEYEKYRDAIWKELERKSRQ